MGELSLILRRSFLAVFEDVFDPGRWSVHPIRVVRNRAFRDINLVAFGEQV